MSDKIELDPVEARVLGVLIEKDLTTPDGYPLTLNSATLGANQKSNRDPVMNLLEGEVYAAVTKLIRKGLLGSVHPMGSRVEKFRHNTTAVLEIDTPQMAVLAELMMRGPQQPGELRARASRMAPIETLAQLMDILKSLIERGYVVRLEPTPGSRAESYAQTVAPTAHPIDSRPAPAVVRAMAATIGAAPAATHSAGYPTLMMSDVEAKVAELYETRIAALEFTVAKLNRQLDHLAWKMGHKLEG